MFALALILAQACAPAVPEGPEVGQRAPALRAVDEVGGDARLPADAAGEQTVLFWTSWCGSCAPLARELAAADRALVLVNAGEAPAVARAARPVDAAHALLDPDGRLRSAYRVDAVPVVLVVDADGVIRHRGALAPGPSPGPSPAPASERPS